MTMNFKLSKRDNLRLDAQLRELRYILLPAPVLRLLHTSRCLTGLLVGYLLPIARRPFPPCFQLMPSKETEVQQPIACPLARPEAVTYLLMPLWDC